MIDAALEAGITFLDTADTYGSGESERFIGAALGDSRDRVVLASKFGQNASVPGPGGSRDHVRRAIDGSLERLGMDRSTSTTTPARRRDAARGDARRHAGARRRRQGALARALERRRRPIREAAASGVTVVAVQNHYSLAHRDDDAEVLPLCRELGIGYVPYFRSRAACSPGKYRRGEPAPEGSRLSGDASATRSSTSPRRWRSSRPSRAAPCSSSRRPARSRVASVIAGATSPEQVRANAAAGSWHASEGSGRSRASSRGAARPRRSRLHRGRRTLECPGRLQDGRLRLRAHPGARASSGGARDAVRAVGARGRAARRPATGRAATGRRTRIPTSRT